MWPLFFSCCMKRIASEIAWQGDSWHLQVDTLQLANNTAVTRGHIVHPGAVVLLPLRPSADGWELLMLRQYRPSLGRTILELPAGTRHWDEPWLDCAQRELREETGYRAERFVSLGDVWPAPGLSDELMKLYIAFDLTPDPLPADADEAIILHPMPFQTARQMAEDGRLQDGKSIIALLRTAVYLRQSAQSPTFPPP